MAYPRSLGVFLGAGGGDFAAMLSAGQIAARLGHQILAAGAGVMAAACLLLALTAHASTSLALLPGLTVAGFGIGMVLVPLTATALANIAADHAGAASGVLATGLQVGGALMIALIGVVFFGALGRRDFAHAFAVSLVALAALTAVTAALVQLLPRPGSQVIPAGRRPAGGLRARRSDRGQPGHGPGGRDVQGRIAVEDSERLEPERDGVDRHDRPVLRPRDVVNAERVPQHHVGVVDGAVLRRPAGSPSRPR